MKFLKGGSDDTETSSQNIMEIRGKSNEFLDITGMTCQSCVVRIEKKIGKLEGVEKITVNLATNIAEIIYAQDKIKLSEIIKNIKNIGYEAELHKENIELNDRLKEAQKKELTRLKIAMIFAIMIIYITVSHMFYLPLPKTIHPEINPVNFSLVQLLLSLPILWISREIYIRGLKAFRALSPSMDSLIAIGTGAAFLYSFFGTYKTFLGDYSYINNLYYEVGDVIIALAMLGKFLENISKRKTSEAINKLGDLRPKKANLLRNDQIIEIFIEELSLNDVVLIKPGEKIPGDGKIISGHSFIDESMITGESIPTEKTRGDRVIGGTQNKNGSLTVSIEAVGKDTTLSRIIKLVEEAQGSKAPIAKLVDIISAYFVPIVIVIAVISSILWYYTGLKGFIEINNTPEIFALNILIAVLVIACPCALGLATPTAIMVGTGKGATEGILIKGGEPLETAYKIDTIVFDKTGTITEGKPKVTDIYSVNLSEDELLYFVGSSESYSEHPLGEAIVNYTKDKKISLSIPTKFVTYTGKGIETEIDQNNILIGNEKLMIDKNISNLQKSLIEELSSQGKTPLLIAINNIFSGIVAVADTIKIDSKEAVLRLEKMGIDVIMLTGDNQRTAKAIGEEAGIRNVIAEVMPEEKSNVIKALQENGKVVAMVGDGINDAPSLARANVGIAIGNGTDIAIESADIVLMKNSILDVPRAITLSRKTINNIKQNLFWAFIYNIIGIPVAAGALYLVGGPLMNPMIAGAAMAMSSVSVVSNVLRLRKISLD